MPVDLSEDKNIAARCRGFKCCRSATAVIDRGTELQPTSSPGLDPMDSSEHYIDPDLVLRSEVVSQQVVEVLSGILDGNRGRRWTPGSSTMLGGSTARDERAEATICV